MSSETKRPPLKHVRLAAAIVAVGVAVWACTGLMFRSSNESTNDAYVMADFTLVAARVAGQISEVLVDDNQSVKAGQLLVRLDDRDFRAALQSAQADVVAAKALVANFDAEIARHPSLVLQAKAKLQSDDASIAFARANASRYQNLSEAGAGTAQEQQRSSSALAEQLAQQAHDRAGLSAAEQNLDVLRTQRDKALGAQARAEAALEQAKLNLSYTEIHAPVDGKIGRRSARVGAYVTTAAPVLAIVPIADAYVVANFQENQITHMRPGQSARIRVDSLPGVEIRGHIDSLAPATGVSFAAIAPDNATGNFTKIVQRVPVKITIDHGQKVAAELGVGLSVVADVDVSQGSDAPAHGGNPK
ncbi:HlyD family secretion protein [Cupriavidus pauculus]|uniref:HlyD family secretion protein n=1 Tax=Cupriavidus pauculus TaxID=82633 RepID=UPI001EE231FD|nr:HlyD family secretion protein [Cupriavidus pauculus]GJG98629.1 HlyD family secretion protein [Cupriavidus pauculus]